MHYWVTAWIAYSCTTTCHGVCTLQYHLICWNESRSQAWGRNPRWVAGGLAGGHGAQLGTAQKQRHRSVLLWSITPRMSIRCCVWCGFGHGPRPGSWQSVPWLWKLPFGTWTIAFLVGKELEVMEEVDWHQPHIVSPTLTQRQLWNQCPWEGLDSFLCWSCKGEGSVVAF